MSTACECVCVCTALISRLRAGARDAGRRGVAMKTKQHLKVKANGKRLAKKGAVAKRGVAYSLLASGVAY